MACAKFCRDQQFALDQIRMFTDRETKIGLFIQVCCFSWMSNIFGSVISSNHTRSIDAGYFYECLNIACSVGLCVIIGPIPWGHSSPLCHALSSSLSLLSLSWTSMRRRHATVPLATSDEMA